MVKKGSRALLLLVSGIISASCSTSSTSYFYGTRPNGEQYAYSISDVNGDEKPDLLGIVSGRIPSSNEEFSRLSRGERNLEDWMHKFPSKITFLGTSQMGERYTYSPSYKEKIDEIIGESVPIYLMPKSVELKFREGLSLEDFRKYPIEATYWPKLDRNYK